MSNTTNYNLQKVAHGTLNYDTPINDNFDIIDEQIKNRANDIDTINNKILLQNDIPNTNQMVTQDTDGNITNIQHISRTDNTTVIREDVFDYSTTNLVVETRTLLSNNTTLIYKYHTDTLETEVI